MRIQGDYYCSLHLTIDMISNKWESLVLFHLLAGAQRSGVLQRVVPEISNKVFTQTVRELERDGLLERTVHPVVPPHVEYQLTTLGRLLEPILKSLDEWGRALMR